MHLEVVIGQSTIIYGNTNRAADVDVLLSRIASACTAMSAIGYPDLNKYKIVMMDDPSRSELLIDISMRPCGIYASHRAYHKQIARKLQQLTGLPIMGSVGACAAVEIGLGGIDAKTEGYAMLKDALITLPEALF